MGRYSMTLDHHLRDLSTVYPLSILSDYKYVIVHDFRLPPGFNYFYIDILVEIPEDYPCSPPGVDTHICVPPDLRFREKKLEDVYKRTVADLGEWGWFCYHSIDWDPNRGNLIKLMEMVRTDLTNPPTKIDEE